MESWSSFTSSSEAFARNEGFFSFSRLTISALSVSLMVVQSIVCQDMALYEVEVSRRMRSRQAETTYCKVFSVIRWRLATFYKNNSSCLSPQSSSETHVWMEKVIL